ncbi:MAG: threonylcarbamoyl-AMP synthase [Deltaproteobacteria bacterium]|nr:threonylcarbamoyl-AMP synthase [Deltaproteobacteria bacterium]
MSKRKIESSEGRSSNPQLFSRAVTAIRQGEVIVFPTETFYGLGADALNSAAVEKVVSLKGRNLENPIAVIIADREMLKEVVAEVPPTALRLMERFWPGPLTVVLAAKKTLPAPLLNSNGGIGIRISSHPAAARLARELGRPLTATSANPSGKEPARTVEEAIGYFSGHVEIFLDGGRLGGTKGSTVVEIVGDRLKIIREGEIRSQDLEKSLGR